MLENLRWYIQHLIHESGYLYDDDESNYPLSEVKSGCYKPMANS